MKFVPVAISSKIARQVLLAQKNSPTILFGAGVVGMLGSTVLACRATLKLEGVLEETQHDLNAARDMAEKMPDDKYSEQDRKQDSVIIYSRAVHKMVRLYGPSVLLGGVSIFALTKSHNILKDRNLQLTAAYVAIDEAFKRYRARVVEKYGDEEDRKFRYDSEYIDIIDDETGKLVSTVRVTDEEPSGYARWFDEESALWNAPPNDGYNMAVLRNQQNWWNDVLLSRGHVFLNEVYGSLGLAHTKAGAVVGWVKHSEEGDNYIDFGLWDAVEKPLDFFNGRDGALLLDFNVDGVIYDKLDTEREDTPWRM